MAPALGPVSPALSGAASSTNPGNDEARTSRRVPQLLDTVPQREQEVHSSDSSSDVLIDASPAAIGTRTSAGRTDDAQAAQTSALPKTCLRCGRFVEASSSEGSLSGRQTSGTEGITAAALPSPSSVAFAPSSHSASSSSDRQAHGTSITAMLAATPAVQEALHLEADRLQICHACLAEGAGQQAEQPQRQAHMEANRSPLAQALSERAIPTDIATPADVIMAESSPPMSSSDSREIQSHVAQQHLPAAQEDRTSTQSSYPWQRPAPWSRNSHAHQQDVGGDSSTSARSLSIRVGDMGVGGDAVFTASNNADFPPLASPGSAPSTATMPTPRIPPSPSRGRTSSYTGTPVAAHAVQSPSFSRTQAGSSAGGPAFAAAVESTAVPVVRFPNRGRTRAESSGGFNVAGEGAGPVTASQIRRFSGARRLSRSSSSQGPTAASFAAMGEAVSESAIAEDELSKDWQQVTVGPHAMTRPRLSLLSMSEISKTLRENSAHSGRRRRDECPNALFKPFARDDRSNINVLDEERKEIIDARDAEVERLQWFDCSLPDPALDPSRLRCQSQGRGCLFPGSIFRGTQKSGRMCYDVTVQIANVDLNSSYLCGYLNIRGLTDDWPELTTYFDAEIIGQRHGFLTSKWGATEADDMKHWGRFTPFRPIRNSLTKPDLRFNHMNKPFIFMRWKERFLVPDHRVRDINGASFAGFYYVCVELGEEVGSGQVHPALTSPSSPPTSPGAPYVLGGPASTSASRRRRSSTSWRRSIASGNDIAMDGQTDTTYMQDVQMATASSRGPSAASRSSAQNASAAPTSPMHIPQQYGPAEADPNPIQSGRMSGFYFHENSEPYQQLTLRHIPEKTSSTFELR